MKFEVDLKKFSDLVGMISKNIPAVSNIPVLSGIKLQATEKGLYLTGGNENMMIEACMSDSVEIFEDGDFLIPAKHFAAILKKLSTETIKIEAADEKVINIKSGNTEIKLNGMDTEQYPRFLHPQFRERKCLTIKGSKLKKIIRQTAFATAKHEVRPGLTGTLIKITEEGLKFVATDSHRLAQFKMTIDGSNSKAIVPGKELLEVSKLLGDDELISVYINYSYFICESSSMTILVRLLDANYPNTDRIIPKEFKTKVKLDTGWLLPALERVGIMAAYNTVKMQVKAQSLFVSSLAPEYGMAGEEVIIESMEGQEMSIHFNVKYLIEALRAIGERTVEFGFNGSLAPFLISPADCEDQEEYLHLIVPVRPATA